MAKNFKKYNQNGNYLTAEEKGTISAIVGLASSGAPLGANSGDVGTATQAGQLSQNTVENNLFGVLNKDKSANKAKNNEYFQKLSACTTLLPMNV